jgi:membrane-associated phospholipid phosphatase
VDLISNYIYSIHNQTLEVVGQLINNNIIYFFLLIGIVVIFERKNEKRAKIIIAIFVALISCILIKNTLARDRPCVNLLWCPQDYSFPSIHSATAFTLMMGFLRKQNFPLILLFSLFVAFTRINIGVHTIEDVSGALPIAILAYYFVHIYWSELLAWKEKIKDRFFTS